MVEMVSLGFSESSLGNEEGENRGEERVGVTEATRMAKVALRAADVVDDIHESGEEKDKTEEIVVRKPNLAYTDFSELYSDGEIREDMRYVVNAVQNIREKAGRRGEEVDTYGAPRVLEWVTSRGILTYDWLGLRGFDTKVREIHTAAKPQDPRHRLDDYTCLSYDDSAHKIDAAFELESPEGETVPFGLDLTIMRNSGKLQEKLRASHNSRWIRSREEREHLEGLPDGFSAIKYGYVRISDQESVLSPREMVPRFVVGVDKTHTLRLNGLMSRTERGGISPEDVMFDPEIIATRFKMLAEIHEQAETLKVRSYGNEHSDEARRMLDTLSKSAWRSINATLDSMDEYLKPVYAKGAEAYNEKLERLMDLTFEIEERRDEGRDVNDLLKRRYKLAVSIMAEPYEKAPDGEGVVAQPDETFREIIFQNRRICGSPYGSEI